MIQALPQPVTFDEFIAWYPENSPIKYELHNGVILKMPKPTGFHSKLAGFVIDELNMAIRNSGKRGIWFIPKECIVKPNGDKSGYEPDIIVLNQETMMAEPRWEKESIIENATSVKVVIEVASSNWRDDYFKKYSDYEEMGIGEYWIIDHAALASRKFIGNPKQPTISIHQLIEGEYQATKFCSGDRIQSPTFPELELTPEKCAQERTLSSLCL